MDKQEYLSVSLLNQYLERKFRLDPYLDQVFLVGELSNFRIRPGHQYFSLKDEHSKINAVMFKSAFEKIKFKPEDGMKVLVVGTVTLYQPSGNYQINIKKMEPDGIGALYQAYEQLKKDLQKEGLFDLPKKPIPRFPTRIAVVTSPSGAVILDIITTASRRYKNAEIDLFPAVVQGDQAKYSIVDALKQIESMKDQFDVIIIGRGGGSIEDLWPFNEEIVVRQIAKSSLPVISSVGHETDTTLSDFVADQRAATPTAAAELVTPDLMSELANIKKLELRLVNAIINKINFLKQQVAQLQNSYFLKNPAALYEQQSQKIDLLSNRLNIAIQKEIVNATNRFELAASKLNPNLLINQINKIATNNHNLLQMLINKTKNIIAEKQAAEKLLVGQLDSLSPLKVISRGYAIVTNSDKTLISSVKQLEPNENLKLRFIDGYAKTTVREVTEEKDANQEK